MLRLLSILSLLLLFSCQTQIENQEFENLEAHPMNNIEHDDIALKAAIKKQICPYLFINIVTTNPDLLDETMCVCPALQTGICYSTGELGNPFSQTIAIPIGISQGCSGFVEGNSYIVGLGDEAPFSTNNATSIQLFVQVTNANTAASVISYYPETNTFSLENVGSGMTLNVLTNFWLC